MNARLELQPPPGPPGDGREDARERRAPAEARPGPQVRLHFTARGTGRTWLETQHAAYPFHVGRCLAMAGDPPGMATVYVQSCSGGIFEHDRLCWRIGAGAGARAHVSTAASTIVHGMTGAEAVQDVWLDAGAGALLEYLPEPLILFPGARLRNRLRIRLAQDATVLAWDALLAHDPKGEDGGTFERIDTELEVEAADGSLLARDRYRLSGASFREGLPGVNGRFRCQGSFAVLHAAAPAAPLLDALREALGTLRESYAGASALPNGCGVLVRVLAPDAASMRIALNAAWSAARPLLLGPPGYARRR